MECLNNYIGLKNCGTEEPVSGYYVNDLQGISTELAHRIADQEQMNFAGVWNSVQIRAQRRFGQLVQRFINKQQNWNEILYQTSGFKITTPLAFQAVSEAEAVVNLPEGKYVEANVKTVLMYSQAAKDPVTLTITDAFGNVLKTIPDAKLTVGLNRIPVGFVVGSEDAGLQFTVKLTAAGLNLNPLTLNNPADLNGCEPVTGAVQVNGLIIPEIDIKCSVSRYICENVNLFTYPLWYLHGAELLAEKLTSPRTTYFATGNLEYTKELQKDFYTEFEESTIQALKAINWQGLCVSCKEDNPSALSWGSMIA